MKIIFILSAFLLSMGAHSESFLGKTPIQTVYHPYASGSVTTGAWTALITSLPSNVSYAQIIDTSGQVMKLATGASGSEVAIPFTIPRNFSGSTGFPFTLRQGVRVSIEASSTTASTGEIIINFFQ